jgi:hypothetical protein
VYTIQLDSAQLDDTALNRIVTAVGAEPIGEPHRSGFDPDARDQLRSALLGCAAYYHLAVEWRSQPARRLNERAKIVAALKTIQEQFANDRYLQQHSEAFAPLIADASIVHPEPAEARKMQNLSPFDVLIGRLANIFEGFFRLKARYTITTDQHNAKTGASIVGGEVRSVFADFIEVALTGLKIDNAGKPYARRAIVNALGRARKAGLVNP